jgi:hypothetical protein
VGPPTVVVDKQGAEVRHVQLEHPRSEWQRVRSIAVEVVTVPELDFSEAFWSVTGEDISWGAPVEVVVGADELRSRLFAFDGFNATAYDQARQAEAAGQAGTFIC